MQDAVLAVSSAVSVEAFYSLVGMVGAWLSWLTIRYFTTCKPVHDRVFGADKDDTSDGHLVETELQFDKIEARHEEMAVEIETTKGKVDRMGDRQDVLLRNVKKIGDAVDAEIDEVDPWRPGNDRAGFNQPDDD